MDSITHFLQLHQVLSTVVIGYVWSSFISALPSPTARSSQLYVFAFKFFNVLAANISRANGPKVENSPNFQDAVKLQQNGAAKVWQPPTPGK